MLKTRNKAGGHSEFSPFTNCYTQGLNCFDHFLVARHIGIDGYEFTSPDIRKEFLQSSFGVHYIHQIGFG